MVYTPIITSVLDLDMYKLAMGQLVFTDFPTAVVEYEFFNRNKTPFPEGFANVLNLQIRYLSHVAMTPDEEVFLYTQPGLRPNYIEWFKNYRFNPNDVRVEQVGGDLRIKIRGYWFRTIYWETILMAVISELFFRLTGQNPDSLWMDKIENKAATLQKAEANWSDFSTRRRYAYNVQNRVVGIMSNYRGFVGTSNVHFAMMHRVKPIGTSAHEMVMGLSALYGVHQANYKWQEHWSRHFNGLNGIALTDTFTTDVFLRTFDSYYARLFDGVRHDSECPFKWGEKMIAHYENLGIDPTSKKLVFSDGLNVETAIEIHNFFKGRIKTMFGIGTNFSNDVGVKPLNMVIKLTSLNGKPVVKLSDSLTKHTGITDVVMRTKQELGLL